MIEILEQYQNASQYDDLFIFWEKELTLRQHAHVRPINGPVRLISEEDCDFMFRSLYFSGRQYDFYSMLVDSLPDLTTLKWLSSHEPDLMPEFLHYLGWILSTHPVKPEKLIFLVNLFRPDLKEFYIPVCHVLDLEQCRYLAARTANSQFRQLLKERATQLTSADTTSYSLRGDWQPSRSHMTIHGDKALLLQKAARKIELAARGRYADPAGPQRFNAMLEACDLVYQCGLAEDALLMLAGLYRRYQEKNRLVDILEDRRIYKYFSRLARILLPICVLLESPRAALTRANTIWQHNFNLLSRDMGSLYYLGLYETIGPALQGHGPHILWEVLYKSNLICQHRPQDRGPLLEPDVLEKVEPERIREWVGLAGERVYSRPHESFILLELLRLLNQQGVIPPDKLPARDMLEIYLDLWSWVPSRLFVNESLAAQLTPLVDGPVRHQVQRLLDTMELYRADRLKQELQSRPDLFCQKDGLAQREILIGHVLGVLS